MPENEFDKQVKKMMEDLKLRPSEGVWPVVEKRIRDKKHRRRALIFLPLLAVILLLGYTVFRYFLSQQENKEFDVRKEQPKNVTKTESRVSNPEIPAVSEKKTLPSIKESSRTPENKKTLTHREQIKNNTTSANDLLNKQVALNKKPPEKLSDPGFYQERKNLAANSDKIKKPGYPPDDNPAKKDNTKNNYQETTVVSSNEISKNKIDTNSFKELIDSNNTTQLMVDNPAKDSAVLKTIHQDKNFSWGFKLTMGVSGSRSKLFQLNKSTLDSRSSPNAGSGGPLYSRAEPSRSSPGIAFQAGALVDKRLSKRSSMGLGLQYSYYSDHIKVGRRTDSIIRIAAAYTADLLVSGFYMNTSTNNYINRYHFIELPLKHHLYLINGKQNSLSWDFGVSFGQLLSTNTLVFDTTNNGLYYTDKKLFRKTQVGLSTGFSIIFNKHKSMQWVIGPQFQLGLTNLYKNYTDKKGYLYFAGVDLRLMLPKK